MNSANSLSGVRVWLSGSIPEDIETSHKDRLKLFAKTLTQMAFRQGAHVIHGCHPSLTRTLLEVAADYQKVTGRKAHLVLVASTAYKQQDGGYAEISLDELKASAELEEIPGVTNQGGAFDKPASLPRMRNALAAKADALVAIGGNWWEISKDDAGVPAEFNLAITRGIPSFLLGGLGGATRDYLVEHPEILRNLRNGLDAEANKALAGEADSETLAKKVLAQIALLPLGRSEIAKDNRFRILSLDGGGIRGAFTAAVLAKWEELAKLPIVNHFDLIAGTSTGGILALGLCLGIPAQKMVEFYEKEGPEIFPMTGLTSRKVRSLRQLFHSKFDASILEEKLRAAYSQSPRGGGPQGTKLICSPHRLLITSYNLTSDNLRLYRTSHHPYATGHDHLSAETVARATSAAPSYFNVASVDDPKTRHEAVDGGVWANCPAMAALCEAVQALKFPLDSIDLLSVGTTDMPSLVGSPRLFKGLLGWAKKAPNLLMKSQMQATLSYVEQLLQDRFLRIDDSAVTNGLDDVSSIPMLINKGADAAETYFEKVRSRFVNGEEALPWRELKK